MIRRFWMDDLGLMLREWDDYFSPRCSHTFRGQFVDTDRYDVIPKKEESERLLKEKEKEIELLDKKREELIKQKDELMRRK